LNLIFEGGLWAFFKFQRKENEFSFYIVVEKETKAKSLLIHCNEITT
jgi:hypothetical protein